MTTIDIKVDLKQTDDMLARLRKQQGLKAGLAAGALHLKSKIAVYPPVRRRRQPPKTDKQRRFLFYAIAAGLIEIPYPRGTAKRSERLGQRWTTQARAGGMTQVVGNNASYAPLVHSSSRQSFYHKGNWQTEQQVAKKHGGEVKRIVLNHIARSARG